MNLNPIAIVIAIVVGLVCLAVGIIAGIQIRKNNAEKEIGSAEQEATRIVNEAIKEAETKKREMVLAAQGDHPEGAHRPETPRSRSAGLICRSRSAAFSRRRRTWTARPRTMEKKDEKLQARLAAAEETPRRRVEALKKSQMELLEQISRPDR